MKFSVVFLIFLCFHVATSGYLYDRGLGADCLYDEDCLTRNSFCKGHKICTCKIGYQYDAGSDVCFPREVNLKCNEDYDCSALQNTKCVNGICNCKNDYVPANDKTACLPSMRLTTLCEEDLQCSSVMNKSYCDFLTRQCVCERGYRLDPYRRECIEQSKLHSPCMSTEDCERSEEIKGKVECRPTGVLTNTCECRLGFYERNEVCYSVGSPPLAISLTTLTALLTVKWML